MGSVDQASLHVLRTAKAAMEEGLIEASDYDVVKTAYLKAQQIKAGMDAGFLREEDYMHARDSFLHALDFRTGLSNGTPTLTPVANSPTRALKSVSSGPPPPPVMPAPAYVQRQAAPSAAAAAAPSAAAPAAAGTAPMWQAPSGPLPAGAVPIPLDLPRIGRAGLADGKKSMSGISLNEICVTLFNHIKSKSSYKWVTYKIDDAGNQVVPEHLGAATSSYAEFCGALPESQCRYGVYDYAYANADTMQTVNKLVFVHWAPQGSTIKSKMMYASTKDFFKSYLDGVGAELQANDPNDLHEGEMRERVHQALTRK